MAMLVRPPVEILGDTEKKLSERAVEKAIAVNPRPSRASLGPTGALGGGAETLKIRRSLIAARAPASVHLNAGAGGSKLRS